MERGQLSCREFEVVEHIALGAAKKEVADKLNISIYTVETTVKNAYEKLGINKVTDLVLWYCGHTFGIMTQIQALKKQILAIILILIISLQHIESPQISGRISRRMEPIETRRVQSRVRRSQKSKAIPLEIAYQIT